MINKDDEQELAHLFKELLERSGFDIVSFTDPLLAIEHFRSYHEQYSLVLSALRMPGINGMEFAKRIRELNTKVKILHITTFYDTENLNIDEIEKANITNIQKTYKVNRIDRASKPTLYQLLEMLKLSSSDGLDKTDIKILRPLVQNHNNKNISSTLKILLSTIQRRVRNRIEKGFIVSKNYIDYKKFGFTSGTIHIYLSDGNMDSILEQVSKFKGVTSLEVHIGNSDIIAGVVYKEGKELYDIIISVKRMQGVERIVWSERVLKYNLPGNTISILGLG